MRIVKPCFAALALSLFTSCSVDADGSATGLGDGTAASASDETARASTSEAGSSSETPPSGDDAPAEGSSEAGTAPATSEGSSEGASAADAGSEAEASGDASSDESGEPLGEWDYGTCSNGCAADMCIVIEGFEGSFCTTPCIDGACPPAPDGEAQAQCLLGTDLMMPPVNCVLTCDTAAQDCPGGMSCVDAMMGGTAGICLWQG